MFKFEVGSVYYARSACNHDCVFLMKVLSRTEKSVKAEFSGEGVKRAMIRVSDSGEWVMPWHYSMAPVFRAGMCPATALRRSCAVVYCYEVERRL